MGFSAAGPPRARQGTDTVIPLDLLAPYVQQTSFFCPESAALLGTAQTSSRCIPGSVCCASLSILNSAAPLLCIPFTVYPQIPHACAPYPQVHGSAKRRKHLRNCRTAWPTLGPRCNRRLSLSHRCGSAAAFSMLEDSCADVRCRALAVDAINDLQT